MTSPASILSLLRSNPNFRKLYLARLVSLFGDWFHFLAVIALLRAMGASSSLSVGWMLIFKTLPSLAMTPLAGVAADRLSRRWIMIVSDLVRFAIVSSMFLLILFPSVPLLYTLVILQTASASFFQPAQQALIPDLVSERELTAANALNAATWSAMLTLGAAVGGVVTAKYGWRVALTVDALSYLVSAAILLTLVEPEWEREQAADEAVTGVSRLLLFLGITDTLAGFRYVLERPRILSLMLVKTGWCVAGSITLILTVLGEQVFTIKGQAMLGVAVLYSARGLGTGAGPFLARWWSQEREDDMERCILYGYGFAALFYSLLPLSSSPVLAALCVALAHIGGATVWVMSTIRLQQLLPSSIRGRVFAAEQGAFVTMLAFSTWAYGALLDSGELSVLGVVSLLGMSFLLPMVVWLVRGGCYGWAGEAAVAEAGV